MRSGRHQDRKRPVKKGHLRGVILTQSLNLDAIYPEKKILTLGGKEFDVTRMPLGIFINLQKKAQDKTLDIEGYQDLTIDWLCEINEDITPEWVKEQLDDTRKMRAIQHNLFNKALLDPLEEFSSDEPTAPEEKQKKIPTS